MRLAAWVLPGCLCLFVANVEAQMKYVITQKQEAYRPLSGATTLVLRKGGFLAGKEAIDNEGYEAIRLNFRFPFFEETYDSVGVNANGLLLFGDAAQKQCNSDGGKTCRDGRELPSTSRQPHNFIAPWWGDLHRGPRGEVRYRQTATELEIEFDNWSYYRRQDVSLSFTVKLSSTGDFEVRYGAQSHLPNVGDITAGFENSKGTGFGLFLPCAASCSGADWTNDRVVSAARSRTPELSISTMSVEALKDTSAEARFFVSMDLLNTGRDPARGVKWTLYRSEDAQLSPATDTALLTSGPIDLSGGSSITQTAEVWFPRARAGYLIAMVDSENVVAEDIETNNTRPSPALKLGTTDHQAVAVTGGNSLGPGAPHDVTIRYRTQGPHRAHVGVRILLLNAGASSIPAGAPEVFSETVLIEPNMQVEKTHTVTVPKSLPAGEYVWALQLDAAGAYEEGNERNDAVISPTRMSIAKPDLQVESATLLDAKTGFPTTQGAFGDRIRLRVKMRNAGDIPAAASTLSFAISNDNSLSLLVDHEVHQASVPAIPAGQIVERTFDFLLPSQDAAKRLFVGGRYYFFVILDSKSELEELSETNNIFALPEPALLRGPGPDYVAVDVSGPNKAAAGEIFPVSRTIRNHGKVEGPKVAYRYVLSANAHASPDDIPLFLVSPSGGPAEVGEIQLMHSAQDVRTEWVQVPAGAPAGKYYIGCIVDFGDKVFEENEADNAKTSVTSIQVLAPGLSILAGPLPDGAVGQPYRFQLASTGGVGASFGMIEEQGALPEGLTLDSSGLLYGTPTQLGIYPFTAVVRHGQQVAEKRLALRVLAARGALAISTQSLPPVANETAAPYEASLTAAGGSQPYAWRLISGKLPGGLALSEAGAISGKLAEKLSMAELPLVFEVRDAVGSRATAALKLRVVEPGTLVIATTSVPTAQVGGAYASDFSARLANGQPAAAPLKWRVNAGALPTGLTFSAASADRGLLTGSPREHGLFPFSLTVQDALGRSDSVELVLEVLPMRLSLIAADAPTEIEPGQEVQFTFTAAEQPLTQPEFALVSGLLPEGLVLEPNGTVHGTVAESAAPGSYSFSVSAKQNDGKEAYGAFALSVGEKLKGGCASSGLPTLLPLWLSLTTVFWLRRKKRPSDRRS